MNVRRLWLVAETDRGLEWHPVDGGYFLHLTPVDLRRGMFVLAAVVLVSILLAFDAAHALEYSGRVTAADGAVLQVPACRATPATLTGAALAFDVDCRPDLIYRGGFEL